MINRNYRFIWGCQASINIADQPELMQLMYEAGCRTIFVGFESSNPESLKALSKKHNVNVNYKEAVKKIHKHKITVIASCIIGMDEQKKDYHKLLIKELKSIKVDYVRVFFMTAWPGTKLYKKLNVENRTTTDWDKMRKDIPSVKFKHYTHEEILAARKEVMDAFFNWPNLLIVMSRWLFKDRALMGLFLKLCVRNKLSERIRNIRANKFIQ
jgi:radical SAM superfamily enzyme YgiQ (UPF0313 family)